MNISAIVITQNEEKNLPRLMASLKDCEEILIFDNESTDKTKEIATKMGAKVFNRIDEFEIPTQKDVDDFTSKFGYKPSFTVQDKLKNSEKIRNKCLSFAKNDWVFFPDADEIVTWSFADIKKMTEQCDQIECKLIQSREPETFNYIIKLFKKSRCSWQGRNHEVVVPFLPCAIIKTDLMKIDHYQIPKKDTIKPNLEYGILKNNDSRSIFYLGREFYYEKNYNNAIEWFDRYIANPASLNELAEVYYHKALAFWNSQRGDEARTDCLHAIEINANMKKAHLLMATMIRPEMKPKWEKFAEMADNSNVVFP